MAAEMARSPAAPGLLFTAASVKGFSVASEVVSNLVDRTSLRAQQVGAEVIQKLQQACDNAAVQTAVSQGAFQEWKGLMTGILSKEASKMQAELDHASRTVSSWQQHKPAGAAQSDAQPHGKSHQHSDLEAHPLSLPQFEMPQLESGWLVEAVQQRFPNIGAPSAWPTSFSVAASSDSMSVSDDEESRAPSSPASLASQFMTQARHFSNQVAKSSTGEAATLHSREPHAASSGNDLGSIFMTKARQLTGQRFDMSPFSPASFADRSTFKLGQGGKSSDGKLLQPGQENAVLSAPERPSPATLVHSLPDAGHHRSAVRSPAARSSEASTTEPDSSAPTAPFKGPSTADAHFSQPSSTPIVPTTAPPDRGKTAGKAVRVIRPEPTPNWRTPRPLTPPPTPVQQGHPLSAFPTAVELDSTVADTSSAADSVAERPDQALNADVDSQHENEPLRSQTNSTDSATPSRLAMFLLSSRFREALQNAVASVKAQFTTVEEQHAVVDEVESGSADEPEGIETNILVKEGDTAWSIAEEYTGSVTSWPEVVASNPNVDTAKPVAGTTLRVRVRM
ncbi:hypothetical protein WJX82_001970 [Trebouxia sp. C0006]